MTRADASAPGPLGVLQTELSTMSMHAPGNVGIMVEDLATGLSTSVNANAQMPAASTIKIPVMVEVFKRLAHGDFAAGHADITKMGRAFESAIIADKEFAAPDFAVGPEAGSVERHADHRFI